MLVLWITKWFGFKMKIVYNLDFYVLIRIRLIILENLRFPRYLFKYEINTGGKSDL